MTTVRVFLAIALLSAGPLRGQDAARWTRADSATVRLEPSAFPELPTKIRADLARRGCRVPQSYVTERPHNVVAGHFLDAARRDWAVLCSVSLVSRVLVYRAGASTTADSLAREPDRKYLQGWGEGRIVYSREISVLHPDQIREYYAGPSLPIPVEHDGINDAFSGKTSVLHYWQRRSWHVIEGEH